jgi:hypothetical protein
METRTGRGLVGGLRHAGREGKGREGGRAGPGAHTRPLSCSTYEHFVGHVGYTTFPWPIRQRDKERCDQHGLGWAEKWTSVSP